MASEKRQMALVGFMQAGNATVYAGSWRHPATEHGFLEAGYYQKLGRTLEEGCFDLMFFDDRLAMPGIFGGSVAEAVRTGARPVKLDLSVVLGDDERYDRADEFMEATTGLWDTWDDDALVLDRANGVFADPDAVRELNY